MLAMHENVQEKIAQEITDVFGEELTDAIDIEYEKLSQLSYTDMAIKETLRLFSPATGKTRPSSHLSCMQSIQKGKGKTLLMDFFVRSLFSLPLLRSSFNARGEKRRKLGQRGLR